MRYDRTEPIQESAPKPQDQVIRHESVSLPGAEVIIYSGDLTQVPAQRVVASANNYLILGSGSAGRVREAGGQFSRDHTLAALGALRDRGILNRLPVFLSERALQTGLSKIQLACLVRLASQPLDEQTGVYQPLSIGSVVETQSYDLATKPNMATNVFHVICMGYTLRFEPQLNGHILDTKIPTTPEAIHQAIGRLLVMMQDAGVESVNVPLIGCNKGGLTVTESVGAVMDTLKQHLSDVDSSQRSLTVNIVVDHEKKDEQLVDTIQTVTSH